MTDEKHTPEQAEEELINNAFQELLDRYLASKHRKKVDIITKAFNFAKQAHKGVRRRSGDRYPDEGFPYRQYGPSTYCR